MQITLVVCKKFYIVNYKALYSLSRNNNTYYKTKYCKFLIHRCGIL